MVHQVKSTSKCLLVPGSANAIVDEISCSLLFEEISFHIHNLFYLFPDSQ